MEDVAMNNQDFLSAQSGAIADHMVASGDIRILLIMRDAEVGEAIVSGIFDRIGALGYERNTEGTVRRGGSWVTYVTMEDLCKARGLRCDVVLCYGDDSRQICEWFIETAVSEPWSKKRVVENAIELAS